MRNPAEILAAILGSMSMLPAHSGGRGRRTGGGRQSKARVPGGRRCFGKNPSPAWQRENRDTAWIQQHGTKSQKKQLKQESENR